MKFRLKHVIDIRSINSTKFLYISSRIRMVISRDEISETLNYFNTIIMHIHRCCVIVNYVTLRTIITSQRSINTSQWGKRVEVSLLQVDLCMGYYLPPSCTNLVSRVARHAHRFYIERRRNYGVRERRTLFLYEGR